MVPDPPPSHGSAVTTAAAGAAPHVELGPGLVPVAFAPGRYAVAIQRTLAGGHAAQRLREDSTASLVLELAADGGATACRGWRYSATNDGPDVHTAERFREQRGFRGTYAVKDGVATVTLTADPSVCPTVDEHGATAAPRASAIQLRCVLATPHDHATLRAPALLCEWVDGAPPAIEADAYRTGLAAAPWTIALGGGNGLRVKITGKPAGARTGDATKVAVEIAPAPLAVDAWTTSF